MHCAPPPALVLDTNVVLDWLVFRDPSSLALAEALAAGRLRWLATTAMRDELEHVLTRNDFSKWRPDVGAVLASWNSLASPAAAPAVAPAATLRCSDLDDQKFVDLALCCGATALLSRDRAVLKLAARARPLGLRILTAAAWSRTLAAA